VTTATEIVLQRLREERVRQEARYGEVNALLDSGTGPEVRWLDPYTPDGAEQIQVRLRWDYEAHEEAHGLPTWVHLVREEIAEAFQEADETRLAEELVQVAALCVSWVERLIVVGCEECGNDDGPHVLDGRRLCQDCLETAYHPELAK
jgi:hypothetical protein